MNNKKIVIARRKFNNTFKQIEDELCLRLRAITDTYTFEDFQENTEIDFGKVIELLKSKDLLLTRFTTIRAEKFLKENNGTLIDGLDTIDSAQFLSREVNFKKLSEKAEVIDNFLKGLKKEIA